MTWLAQLSLLLLILQLATAKTIQDEEAKSEENDDENEADENNEARSNEGSCSNMPIEQLCNKVMQNAMVREETTTGELDEFISKETDWMKVFVKQLGFHQMWIKKLVSKGSKANKFKKAADMIYEIVKYLYDDSGKIFKKVRDRLDKRIIYHISKDKIYRVKKLFANQVAAITAKMQWREGTEQGYQYEDLLDLRQYLPDFLPHEPSVDYDPIRFQLMASYLMLYKNFYNGLIANGRIHKCVFFYDWHFLLKETLIKSVKRLTYSYFSHLLKAERGNMAYGDAWLQFEDRLAEPKVVYKAKFSEVKTKVLLKFSDDVAKIMMKNIGNAYNELLYDFTADDKKECGGRGYNEGVHLLASADLSVKYPKSCYGKGKIFNGTTYNCDLPCGKFSETENYCIFFHGHPPRDTEWKLFEGKRKRLFDCIGSSPNYWRTCATIKETPSIADWNKKITRAQEYYSNPNKGTHHFNFG